MSYVARTDPLLPGVLILQFSNRDEMNVLLDPISDLVDGKLAIPRQGHNFPVSHVNKSHSVLYKLIKGDSKIQYIVAYLNGDVKTFQHEFAHAKFFLDPKYKKEMEDFFFSFDDKTRDSITSFLTKLGYEERVWIDEFQAYYTTEKPSFFGLKDTATAKVGGKGKRGR
jgi:hypothetical protein